ncbi:unnamed protein product [Cuscuta campestris]|uniref:ARM repeat superfamily protein n=1 Tax=Cuscuta campestris TaxID=132261 RepID=A0A484M8W8_9ASTE|nr:unnamed protein product [Cuscuta campestris]
MDRRHSLESEGGDVGIQIEKNVINAENPVRAPEKKLTLFALRLAVLEKAATGLGTLGFIWATVVLLGGFAITLAKTDFWFITIILLIEGTRIFSRSHELEWQHQATWSLTDVGLSSFRALKSGSHFVARAFRVIKRAAAASSQHDKVLPVVKEWDKEKRVPTRRWTSSEVPLVPYAQWLFISRNMGKILHWLQIASATTCLVLSLVKLIRQDFGEVAKGDTDRRNRKSALNIFYSLALAEALLFLMEKAYCEWKISIRKLIEEVNRECEFGPSGEVSVKRFFYDAYSKCVFGSVFDGLKMDMVSFGMELLGSNFPDEQLSGAQILKKFSTSPRFSDDTLQKIGTNISVMERLVEMLNWKNPEDEEIRLSSAEILSKLAGKKQNALRVAGIPGAMESISSLLQIIRDPPGGPRDEISEKRIVFHSENYGYWTFNHLGLLILKKLARDHDNCGKIANTRGLLPKIIDFAQAGERLLRDESATPTQILALKRSLQVLQMLASTTGATGKDLRNEISEVVFTVSNLRDILKYGGRHSTLQFLGIDILKSLALEEDASERIGGTGGVLKELIRIFLKPAAAEDDEGGDVRLTRDDEDRIRVRNAAGEALAMLALESEKNCRRILRLRATERLVGALAAPPLRVNAARVLRNLCAYSSEDSDCFAPLQRLTAAGPTILKAIMTEESKLQEVMLGLAGHVFMFMEPQESSAMFIRAGIEETQLAEKLIRILESHPWPSIKVPRIRRFAIEVAIWMMRDKRPNIEVLRNLGMENQMECITETTSEIESFHVFSGSVGMNRHTTTMGSLVETALELLREDDHK